jgi:hypothetical protein
MPHSAVDHRVVDIKCVGWSWGQSGRAGISQMDMRTSGTIGRRFVMWYMMTTCIAVCTSVAVVTCIGPGYQLDAVRVDDDQMTDQSDRSLYTMLDLIRRIFLNNVFQATIQQVQTQFENKSNVVLMSVNETRVVWLVCHALCAHPTVAQGRCTANSYSWTVPT